MLPISVIINIYNLYSNNAEVFDNSTIIKNTISSNLYILIL